MAQRTATQACPKRSSSCCRRHNLQLPMSVSGSCSCKRRCEPIVCSQCVHHSHTHRRPLPARAGLQQRVWSDIEGLHSMEDIDPLAAFGAVIVFPCCRTVWAAQTRVRWFQNCLLCVAALAAPSASPRVFCTSAPVTTEPWYAAADS